MQIKNLAFVVNPDKPGARELANKLMRIAGEHGTRTAVTEMHPLPESFLEDIDACCVLGGDGTLLGVVSAAAHTETPVFGVNHGKLGFMATYSEEEVLEHFAGLLNGNFELSRRQLLLCTTAAGQAFLALNDVVLKSDSARLAQLSVHAPGELVNHYNCDGLIFATPTGSTAYNLSAGGPIVHPSAEVIVATPICPHTLSNRAVVFSRETVLEVTSQESMQHLILTVDGRAVARTETTLPLTVRTAPHTLKLAQHRGHSHFRLIRRKLEWGAND